MSDEARRFLGRGWAFPPRFTIAGGFDGRPEGEVEMVAADADIRQSLEILLSTRRGERIVRPDYGLGLDEHVYSRIDDTELGDLRSQIADAILVWEPRIKVEEIAFSEDKVYYGLLRIEVTYWIPAINSRSNMVFPFYYTEGTNTRAPELPEPLE